jgi:hypothetical protein
MELRESVVVFTLGTFLVFFLFVSAFGFASAHSGAAARYSTAATTAAQPHIALKKR